MYALFLLDQDSPLCSPQPDTHYIILTLKSNKKEIYVCLLFGGSSVIQQ